MSKKMSNLTYVEFMKKTRIPPKEEGAIEWFGESDFPNAVHVTHGSKHKLFKGAYQDAISKPGVKIYYAPKPEILRIGFIVDFGDTQEWHTVRLEAWHTKKNRGCEIDAYVLKEEIKERAEKQLVEIMEEIDPDKTLGVQFALHDDIGNIDYLSLWAKDIHVSRAMEVK